MIINNFQVRASLFALLVFSIFFGSCKKSNKEEPRGTRSELSADSMFLYAKEVYLWNESLPSYDAFNPRQYVSSDEEAGLNKELFKITRYATNSYELNTEYPDEPKYSYIFNTADANPVAYVVPAKSSVNLDGTGYDFGFQVGLYGSKTSYEVRVLAVYKGSPADLSGIKRGDIFTEINGTQVSSNYIDGTTDYFLNAALFDASSVTLQVKKASSGTISNLTLARTSYRSNPVYQDTVYSYGTQKIGYLAFARFSDLTTNAQTPLDQAFSRFSNAGVTDLIIDLRYNGGGYVTTAEYLANLIIPGTVANGATMYKQYYNSLMQSKKATILKNQPFLDANDKPQYIGGKLYTYADVDFSVAARTTNFSKTGPLTSVQKVVFIVTNNTASASELVINSLKPYFAGNIKIVGEKTYGKPVGFFPITIDKYEVYFSMFETKNSADAGGYYSGMDPDNTVADDYRYDFGDLRESSIASAYNYLITGSYTTAPAKISSVSAAKTTLSQKIETFKPARREFKGMIENRFKLK